ncbi:ATP synthase subunit I [Anoxynatronum buryatiense]|uniref:ATP synthase I chain n=1 Tax=Anoxynatronum buryatiense TaxID=489973 RepID=A0AA46AIN1_9CLOT|nr:ATP synthase subunit I [Anoxynatronum buryatiense]SMP52340.1 ATP synthase I chain [Anoxynatronum buryatiense]
MAEMEDISITQKSIAKRVFLANSLVALLGMWVFHPPLAFLTGVFFGTAVSLLNFRLLYLTIQRAVTMHPERARKYTVSRYMIRYVLTTLVILISIRSPDIHALGTIIAMVMIKIVILQRDLLNDKRYFKNIFTRKEEK